MTSLPGWDHAYSGKVRDLYTSPSQPGRMLVVASDRVSAFDHVLEPGIPGKGALLTRLSLWWFGQLSEVPNHLVDRSGVSLPTARPTDAGASFGTGGVGPSSTSVIPQIPAEVADRAMLVKELDMFPVECVVRGYLSGSGWTEYQDTQSVCGVPLPAGLSDGDRLPEPIYTPAWKAPLGQHDENISFERTAELVGAEVAASLRDLSLEIFSQASAIAESRGLILADTKFEFGADAEGTITLGDEVLTSDSSRYWDEELYATGDRTASFDKQIVRNWLRANWDGAGEPPSLPAEIVDRTAARYRELIDRLTA
jgi:phosphoribosylaminoimidazole-succinocarboxamide synthase